MKNLISSTEGSKKWQITLAKIFNCCFLIAMILVLGCSVVYIGGNDKFKHFNYFFVLGVIILMIIIGASIIYTTFKFFKNHSDTWNQKVQIINWILVIILAFTVTYIVQLNCQFGDAHHCIKTAKELYPTMNWNDVPWGNKTHGQCYALSRYYNLAPLIYLQALIFKFCSLIGIKLSIVGITTIGTYLNTVMLLISMYLAFRLIKKYCSISTQTGFTFLLLINIPLYPPVYYVYTDIPALLSIMVILSAYDVFIHTNITKNKIFNISIIILTSIIGALFKFNVLIALFAAIIHYSLTHNWKHNIKFILLLLIPTMLGISGVKRGITATSPISQDKLGLPAIHWVNMSFSKTNKDGKFDIKYYNHTLNLKKQNNNNNKTVSRIEFYELINNFIKHPNHYFYLMYVKIGETYGVGNYEYCSFNTKNKFYAHPEIKNIFFVKLIRGNLQKIIIYCSFIIQLSFFLFMGLGTWQLIKKKNNLSVITPWMITLFGNMFMLLFWESRSRYLLAFVGTIYMIACFGIEQVLDARDQKKLKNK